MFIRTNRESDGRKGLHRICLYVLRKNMSSFYGPSSLFMRVTNSFHWQLVIKPFYALISGYKKNKEYQNPKKKYFKLILCFRKGNNQINFITILEIPLI